MKRDEGGCIYGAQILLRQLTALEGEFAGVREGAADIEFIHRMRVATRRLRATIPLFVGCLPTHKTKNWVKEIRRITGALGEARDADVQIEHLAQHRANLVSSLERSGVDRLLLRLRQKRAALQPSLVEALDHLAKENTLPEMRAMLEPKAACPEGTLINTPALYTHAMHAVTGCLDALVAFDAIVPDPARVTELHAMRIAAKRLRYTMETFAALYPNELKKWLKVVRDTQETLGTIHDCDVWTAFIPVFLGEERERVLLFYGQPRPYARIVPGVNAYADLRRREREELHVHFAQDWSAWMAKDLWGGLRRALEAPLLPVPPEPEVEDPI